jgi:hypothetical protein
VTRHYSGNPVTVFRILYQIEGSDELKAQTLCRQQCTVLVSLCQTQS